MPVKNFVISFLIVASTVVGGACFFGFCAFADSGYIIETETSNDIAIAEESDNDIPIAETLIKEDGKLDGKILAIAKPEIDFGVDFDLVKNQRVIAKVDAPVVNQKTSKSETKIASVKTTPSQKKNIDSEMASVLAEIKKQEQEVRELLSELKEAKAVRKTNKTIVADTKVEKPIQDENVFTSVENNITDSVVAPKLDVARVDAVQTEEKEDSVLMAMKGGNIIAKKESVGEKTASNNQKKFQPMIVENTKKIPAAEENFETAFRDYSNDNSGRDNISDNAEFADNSDNSSGGFEQAFSALRPEKSKKVLPNIVAERRKNAGNVASNVSKESVKKFRNAYLSSDDVKKDFYNTYITENRYLSPFEEGGEEKKSGNSAYDILQLKIEFQENSTALSATDVNILRYFVYAAQNDPTKGVQITIGQSNMNDVNRKKLTARRLAIVNAIFKEEGLSDAQIKPILTDRDTDSFAFSIIPVDKMEDYSKGGTERDMFGDTIGTSQTFRTMKW